MNPLSVVIIARNEAKNIGRCLASVSWADEIIMIDSGSEDDTVAVAESYGARIFDRPFTGYGTAKREGVEKATSDWILSIDADEEVTPELRDEIKTVLNRETNEAGFFIKRKTMFLGRWIKHCGWYPDHILRMFRKSRGNFNDAVVHEKVSVEGATGVLKNELLHYSYPSLEDYFRKFGWYTTLGAEEAARRGVRAGWFDIALKPPVSFLSHYVMKQGFRDGLEGFLVSVLSAMAVMVKYAKVREINKTAKTTKEEYAQVT